MVAGHFENKRRSSKIHARNERSLRKSWLVGGLCYPVGYDDCESSQVSGPAIISCVHRADLQPHSSCPRNCTPRQEWGAGFCFKKVDDVLKMPNSQQFLVQDISTRYIWYSSSLIWGAFPQSHARSAFCSDWLQSFAQLLATNAESSEAGWLLCNTRQPVNQSTLGLSWPLQPSLRGYSALWRSRALLYHLPWQLQHYTLSAWHQTSANLLMYTWRIIPLSKYLVTSIYKLFRPFIRGITPFRGFTNHGY